MKKNIDKLDENNYNNLNQYFNCKMKKNKCPLGNKCNQNNTISLSNISKKEGNTNWKSIHWYYPFKLETQILQPPPICQKFNFYKSYYPI